ALGDHLIVLINSDTSVAALKGADRPVVPGSDRARVVAALACVDTVVLFDQLTPVEILDRIRPDVWVKGGDYDPEELPETTVVRGAGGEVVTMPLLTGRSTSGLINRIRKHADMPTGHRPGGYEQMRELGTTIVTGGSSGLGEAVALVVADEGGSPVVLDRQYPHTSMSFEHVDISDRKEVERAVSPTVEKHGRIDAVVNTAGIDACGKLNEFSADEWEQVVAVNLLGTVAVTRAAL